MNRFFVFDTNSLISAALILGSINRKALDKAIDTGLLAVSGRTMKELTEVLFREKFDKYFSTEIERFVFVNEIETHSKIFNPEIFITECRHPKDDKFLELAVAAHAFCIITGDKDLLVMHPFRGIPVLNATDFLNTF